MAQIIYTSLAFGIQGDGEAYQYAKVAEMLGFVPDYSKVVFEKNKIYLLNAPIVINKPIVIDLSKSIIKADHVERVFDIRSDNVMIINGDLDLANTSYTGIYALGHKNLSFDNLAIRNCSREADNIHKVCISKLVKTSILTVSILKICGMISSGRTLEPAGLCSMLVKKYF